MSVPGRVCPGLTGYVLAGSGGPGRSSRVSDFARGRGSRGAGQQPPATLPTLTLTAGDWSSVSILVNCRYLRLACTVVDLVQSIHDLDIEEKNAWHSWFLAFLLLPVAQAAL